MSCDMESLAAPGVRGLQPYQPGKPVEELERELGLTDVVKLASNENPLGPGPRARAAIAAAAGLERYPDGSGFRLKAALAARHGVAAEAVTLGNGSNDVLEMLVRTFAPPGTEVLFSEHAFAVYPLATLAAGATPVVAPARDHGHDLEAMAAAVTDRTRVVFVANPNNPTGTWVEARALGRFLASLPDHLVAVVDEAYHEYADVQEYATAMPLVAELPRLVVTRTFSKIHGLAGLRVGYSVSRPEVSDLLNRVRQPFNVNSIALAAAEAALEDEAHVARSRAVNAAGRTQVSGGLDRLGLAHIPTAANFVTFDTGRAGAAVYEAMLRRGVIVRPVGGGYGLPTHLRATIGTATENDRMLAALEGALAEVAP